MITSVIGKIFLNAYNEEYGTNYDARTFFLEKFFPLFFDSDKKMLKAGNTSLGNPAYNKKTNKERLNILLEKIRCGQIDSSVCLDFPSFDSTTRNSGQVSELAIPISQDDVFLSWIGNGLKVGIKSDLKRKEELSILFFDKKILLDLSEGWIHYREALDCTKNLQGNQVHLWNTYWLSLICNSKNFDKHHPPKGICMLESKGNGSICIKALDWIKITIDVARQRNGANVLSYISGMDKNNNFTTIGFRTFIFTNIKRPLDLYEKYFGLDDGRIADTLWGTAHGIKTVCTNGTIGIKAMEPEGLMGYIRRGGIPKISKDKKTIININVYKIWILAMLNNEELWDKSQELAELLNAASIDKDKAISTKRKNLVENVLDATNKKQFIAAATEITSFVTDIDKFKEIVKEIHGMPTDNVPYFLTLVRFQFKTL